MKLKYAQASSTRRRADRPNLAGVLWSYRATFAAAGVVFVLSAWTTITTVTYFKSHRLWTHTIEDIKDLQRSYANLLADTQLSQVAILEEIKNFEDTDDQRGALRTIRAMRSTLLQQLEEREKQLIHIEQQQERATALISDFESKIAGTEGLLHNVVEEKSFLQERLAAAQGQLAEVSQQRDAGQRVEVGLRWRLSKLESELAQRQNASSDVNELWLREWINDHADAIEDLLLQTGADVDMLMARLEETRLGQGGPIQLASADPTSLPAQPEVITSDLRRLELLQKLASYMPFGSPLDQYSLTSSFGKRSDPITGELAFHGGLDFGAAPNSRIRATARGRVVHAGPLGPYGNTVEIDHGMGVTTRFGHMKAVKVEVGQEVQLRDVIGIIGSTGRSTGRHLHYEVRIDGEAYDPAKFVETGRYLVWAFAAGDS